MRHFFPLPDSIRATGLARAPLAALLLGAGLIAQAQTPAAPTPTTPPSGISPPAPEPAPLPKFTHQPPLAAPAPARPLAAPAPSPGIPGSRPRTPRINCNDQANAKLPICNQNRDTGIQRTPTTKVDPEFARTPPPTGDSVAKGADKSEPAPVERNDATPQMPRKSGVKADAKAGTKAGGPG